MTNELQMLVAELRHPIQRNERYYEPLCARAANELERLAKDRQERTMTDEELCKNLRALSPGYSKMDGSYIEIGGEAADEIERLNLELRNERDVRAEAERGCVSMAKEIKRLVAENKELRARAADRGANDDKPLGFRTWDVPNPYAESPQSDDELAVDPPAGEVYDKIKGHAVTQSNR